MRWGENSTFFFLKFFNLENVYKYSPFINLISFVINFNIKLITRNK